MAFVCCPLVFEFSVGIGGFVIGLSQISFFFSFSIHMILYGSTYIIKTLLKKNIFINSFRNIYKMLINMLYSHFFRNVTENLKFNQIKIFRKCFVLPGMKVLAVL